MANEARQGRSSGDLGVAVGPIWIMGWLFTIGFCSLKVSKAVFALVIWPYFLGAALKH